MRDLLRSSELLQSIPLSEIDELASRVHHAHYERGEIIFAKNDEGSGVMFVASGRVKIGVVSPSGGEVILNFIEPGQLFGEMALLDGKPRSADAIAALDTQIVVLYRKDFLPILSRNPSAAIQMMEILCARIRQATSFVEDAVLLDASTRLYNRLMALATQYGEQSDDGPSIRIDHDLSQQELGDSVGLTRVSINRILSHWRRDKLIEDGRGYVLILDPERLEAAVRGHH